MEFNLKNTFISELPGDLDLSNSRRQVHKACYSFVNPAKIKSPELIHYSKEVADFLGLYESDCQSQQFLQIFSGNEIIKNSKPFAMCYGGHQFGHWAGQLGDGRAINIAEIDSKGKRWSLQLKGAGETPYSRSADGLAVLRSSIREHLCSEAMFHLGVPTTRSLSLSLTGNKVLRDVLYDGNPEYEKGALVCRVAPSFIRFGSFEIFASKKDNFTLKKLTNYTIKHFYPGIEQGTKRGYIEFFQKVSECTLEMIIHWQRVGFVHGVMNTDNMSILGLTIDYGPYGWLEGYDKQWTPNTTDIQHKRYQFGEQGNIALWNLVKLANALYPLIEEAEPLEEIISEFKKQYSVKYLKMMKSKLGLEMEDKNDLNMINQLEQNLELTETDMTIFFRGLGNLSKNLVFSEKDDLSFLDSVRNAFYKIEEVNGEILGFWKDWIAQYVKRLQKEAFSDVERKQKMNLVNPKYVLRNYMAQIAIEAADEGDYTVIEELHDILKDPYGEQMENQKWFEKRPEWARTKVGCSMLSCSS